MIPTNIALQETGKCGDRCYIFTGEEGLLLDVGEDYIDPEDPCNPYVCKVSTDALNTHNCVYMYVSYLIIPCTLTGGWFDPDVSHMCTS